MNVSSTDVANFVNELLKIPNPNKNLVEANNIIKKLNIAPNYPIILIGGTNGKGSTCAYLNKILINNGYKIGTFTSPHMFEYNERILINDIPINNRNLYKYLQVICNSFNSSPSLFTAFTLACHLYFMDNKIDIAIFEVGIGGRYDITNLFEPEISAITSVDLDHCNLLGNSIEEISLEKAYIYRPNKWAFYGANNPPDSLINYTKQISAKLELFNTDFGILKHDLSFDVWCHNINYYTLPYPNLRGTEQPYNVALALAILTKLKDTFPITLSSIKHAITSIKLPGRFQIMPKLPQTIFDVAHNPQAVRNLIKNMVKLPPVKISIAIFGIAVDKDIEQIINIAKTSFNKWYVAKIDSERATDSDTIKSLLIKNGVMPENILKFTSIAEALSSAMLNTTKDDRLVCFGSFLTVSESYNAYTINIK